MLVYMLCLKVSESYDVTGTGPRFKDIYFSISIESVDEHTNS